MNSQLILDRMEIKIAEMPELNADTNEARTKFINFCTYQLSDASARHVYEGAIKRFDSELNFFECCSPKYYIYDAVDLGGLLKHTPKYLYWETVDYHWKNYFIEKHKHTNKRESTCKSIW